MTLPERCIERPVMTTLLMASLIVLGIFAYRLLPVAAMPRVDFPTISVRASLPGASPETMASSVAAPIERQFTTIPGVDSISSTSTQGSSSITVQFDLNRDIDGAALDVQAALSVAQRRLPTEMTTPPSFRKSNPADAPVLYIALSSETLPLSDVDDYAETIVAQRLSMMSGVAQVSVYGQRKFAVRVQADPHALAAAGISLDELQQALAAANSNAPLGEIEGRTANQSLQASGQLARAADYRKLIVAYRDGHPVLLENVAHVIDSVENDQSAGWVNNKPTIILAIQRQADANTVAVVDAVRAALPSLRAAIPDSVSITTLTDRSRGIRNAVRDIQFTLGLTVILVVLVIYLFLRSAQATLIPALALPISIIGTFAGMYLLGFSINNLTLLALTLSVGFIVDDAIVMLENIVRHVESGESPMEAARKGAREITFTIISITLSLVAVFIPVLFMGGVIGRLFREFSLTITMTILISGLVALTLTPMLASRVLRQAEPTRLNPLLQWWDVVFARMVQFYDRTLRIVLSHQRTMLFVTLGTIAVAGLFFVIVPKGFLPNEDTGQIYVSTKAEEGISFEAMQTIQKKAAAVLIADPAIESVASFIGPGGSSPSLNIGRMMVSLKPYHQRGSLKSITKRLERKLGAIPGVKVTLQPVASINSGTRRTQSLYQLAVQGSDLSEVQHASMKLATALSDIPGFKDVNSSLQIENPQVYVDIDRDRAAALNVTVQSIRSTLYAAFGSRQVSTIYTPTNDYQVILELAPEFRSDINALSSIYVPATDGTLVPLDALATIKRQAGPNSVDHQAAMPAVILSFNLTPGVSLGDAVSKVDAVSKTLQLPASVSLAFQGTAKVFKDSLRGQTLLLIAAVLVIYVVLGILYESFVHPITILSGLPAAGLGALLTLWITRTDLSVIAIIGIVMLIGIVKKNAILMIDFALVGQRDGGLAPTEAIYQACLVRFRPIMMTTMAAIMGALPIAIGFGTGSELRQPLGLCVVGGLLVSQLLTLYITPVIYLYLDRARAALARRRETALAEP